MMTFTTTPPASTGHETRMATPASSLHAARRLTPWLLLLAACGGTPEAAPVDKPPVQLAQDQIAVVDSLTVESGPSLSGTLMAERTAQVRSQVSGTLLAVYVREGQAVSAGQAIA